MKSFLHNSKLLWEVAKFNALKTFAYPWDRVAFFAQRAVSLSFLAIFWLAVARSSDVALNFRQLIAYFLIATAVRDLTFASETRIGKEIMRLIKYGEISNYLIKSVGTIPFLFFTYAGQMWVMVVYALAALSLGIFILPPASWVNIAAFLVFIVLAFLVAVSFNFFVAIVSFHVVEAVGIRNVFNHIAQIFSGVLIPLTFFPSLIRSIVEFSPFPAVAFTPTYVLQNSLAASELLRLFAINFAWAAGLLLLVYFFWKRSLRKYEGVGI